MKKIMNNMEWIIVHYDKSCIEMIFDILIKNKMGSLHIYICVWEREIKSKGNSTKPKGACPNTLLCLVSRSINHEDSWDPHFHHTICKFYMKICSLITNQLWYLCKYENGSMISRPTWDQTTMLHFIPSLLFLYILSFVLWKKIYICYAIFEC